MCSDWVNNQRHYQHYKDTTDRQNEDIYLQIHVPDSRATSRSLLLLRVAFFTKLSLHSCNLYVTYPFLHQNVLLTQIFHVFVCQIYPKHAVYVVYGVFLITLIQGGPKTIIQRILFSCLPLYLFVYSLLIDWKIYKHILCAWLLN